MKKIPLYLLLCVVTFATGCPKYRPKVDFNNKNSLVNQINEHMKAKQSAYVNALSTDPEKAKTIRNELIEDALPYIDEAYSDFVYGIATGRDRGNFVADVIELGTSAAVGITKGERPIQILGIALTAFRGGRRSADLNFYKDQSTPILINKMDGNRAKVRKTILDREKDDAATYSIGAAISDIVDYYNAGTLVRAFTELAKDTAVQTKEAEDDLLVLKGVPLTRPSTVAEAKLAGDALAVLDNLATGFASTVATEKANALRKLQNVVAAMAKDDDLRPFVTMAGISATDTDGQKLIDGISAVRRALDQDQAKQGKLDQVILANGQ
ncbi:MAG TPA: hypothetical protein VGC91_14940 [Pyrinomonadaceae bacterium]|jgi:hypothetical protein